MQYRFKIRYRIEQGFSYRSGKLECFHERALTASNIFDLIAQQLKQENLDIESFSILEFSRTPQSLMI